MAGILIVDQIQNSSNTVLINSGALAANTVGPTQLQSGTALSNIGTGGMDQSYLNASSQYMGFKNRLINGAMQVWQRGTSFATGGIYCSDRWFSYYNSFTQSSDAPTAFAYSAALVAAGAGANIQQRIESVNCSDLSGQSVTVSFWAKSVSGSTAINFGLNYANSVDNFSASTGIASQNITITTSWALYTATFSGLPSSVKNGLLLFIGNPSGAASFNVTGVQLEKGSTATAFDYRPYGTELALCQRYLPALNGTGVVGNFGMATSATAMSMFVPFQVPARVAPTGITVSSPSHFVVTDILAQYTAATAISYASSSTTVGSLTATCASGLTTYRPTYVAATSSSAQILFTGCEL